MTIETKVQPDSEVKHAMNDLLYTFEQYKETNDARLTGLEAKGDADPLITDKLQRLDNALVDQKSAIDRLTALAARPALSQDGEPVNLEAKTAFDTYVRTGMMSAPSTKSIAASDSDGGMIAPEETARLIDHGLQSFSPFRQFATVRQISGNVFRKPVATSDFGAGWVAETDARPETTTPSLQGIDFPAMELYAMPATTQSLLDDSIVDIGQWIADEVQSEFAAQESSAFVSGDGTTMPAGILSYPTATEAARAFGELGTTSSTGASVSGDDLIDLVYTLEQAYRQNGRFLLNRQTAAEVRKLKDADGNYLWSPGLNAAQSATLLGYPVTESEDMPDVGNGATPIAFGDFQRGYLIVDRRGIRVLRDPFSAKPYVLFYTTKRVGGGVQDFAAIKFLEMSA